MKKAISILLVLVMALSLCACGGNSNNGSEDSATEGTETIGITTRSEALSTAEQYLKSVLPQLCSGYEYSTGTQLWGWNTENSMVPTTNGWKGVLSGSFQLVTYSGIDDIDFTAAVEIDNTTGTIRLIDVDIDD